VISASGFAATTGCRASRPIGWSPRTIASFSAWRRFCPAYPRSRSRATPGNQSRAGLARQWSQSGPARRPLWAWQRRDAMRFSEMSCRGAERRDAGSRGARRTPATRPPFSVLASLRSPNLLDRKFGNGLSVNARGGKICMRERLVWTGSKLHESSRVEADFEPETNAIGVLRALK